MTEVMTNIDNFWLNMDDSVNYMIITGFMEFEELIDYNRLYATIESRILKFKRFRKKVVKPRNGLGLPKWVVDENFDLKSHIHHIALPAPGNKNALQDLISSLSSQGLSPDKPLWDVHLIENYNKGCVLFFRIHHCIADGIALIHVLLSSADTSADAPWPKRTEKRKNTSSSLTPHLSVNSVFDSAKDMLTAGHKIGNTLLKEIEKCVNDTEYRNKQIKTSEDFICGMTSAFSRLSTMSADPETAFKGKLGVTKSVAWTKPMPLDKIKEVGHAVAETTLNDVLIATVAGAMRKYLKTRNTPVQELDLRVAVPVNIRKPGAEFELGNKFTLVYLSLPVHLQDPLLRLKEVKRRMDELKTSVEPLFNFGLLTAGGILPTGVAKKVAGFLSNKASGVLTNVPGPKETLYYAGKKISNMMFWVPKSGKIGLGISILSYDGKVTVGVTADESRMPDPEKLLEGFEEEFNHLLELIKTGELYNEPLVVNDRFKESLIKAEKILNTIKPDEPYSAVMPETVQCQAITKKGTRCKKQASGDSGYCRQHKKYQAKTTVPLTVSPVQCAASTKDGSKTGLAHETYHLIDQELGTEEQIVIDTVK